MGKDDASGARGPWSPEPNPALDGATERLATDRLPSGSDPSKTDHEGVLGSPDDTEATRLDQMPAFAELAALVNAIRGGGEPAPPTPPAGELPWDDDTAFDPPDQHPEIPEAHSDSLNDPTDLFLGARPVLNGLSMPLPIASISDERTIQAGVRFGAHYLLGKVGEGVHVEVQLAYRDAAPGRARRPCVIKRPTPAALASPERRARFVRAARAFAAMQHSAIVELIEAGEVEGVPFAALELVDGLSLSELRRSAAGKRLPPSVVARIALRLAEALAHLESLRMADGRPAGAVHEELVLESVFLGLDGRVKLGDLGFASLENEQLIPLEQDRIDPRTNVLALAIMLAALLAGVDDEGSDAARLETTEGLPRKLVELIARMMAPNPEARPANTAAVLPELRALADQLEPRISLKDYVVGVLFSQLPPVADRGRAASLALKDPAEQPARTEPLDVARALEIGRGHHDATVPLVPPKLPSIISVSARPAALSAQPSSPIEAPASGGTDTLIPAMLIGDLGLSSGAGLMPLVRAVSASAPGSATSEDARGVSESLPGLPELPAHTSETSEAFAEAMISTDERAIVETREDLEDSAALVALASSDFERVDPDSSSLEIVDSAQLEVVRSASLAARVNAADAETEAGLAGTAGPDDEEEAFEDPADAIDTIVIHGAKRYREEPAPALPAVSPADSQVSGTVPALTAPLESALDAPEGKGSSVAEDSRDDPQQELTPVDVALSGLKPVPRPETPIAGVPVSLPVSVEVPRPPNVAEPKPAPARELVGPDGAPLTPPPPSAPEAVRRQQEDSVAENLNALAILFIIIAVLIIAVIAWLKT